MEKVLLVIAAHPDDEILGCAGTVILRVTQGWKAHLLILTRGVEGREYQGEDADNVVLKQIAISEQTALAAKIVGFSSVHNLGLPDNRLDTISKNDIYLNIKKIVRTLNPSLILTHHPGDYNWDHTLCFEAVIMATRANYPEVFPTEILSFEVLSSTERAWQSPDRAFHPSVYINVKHTIERKKQAMLCYSDECHAYPHPRSPEGIEYLARKRGLEVGLEYAEAFHLIRKIEL